MGLDRIDEIVKNTAFDLYDLKKYFTIHLSYRLDERKKLGMQRFLGCIREMNKEGLLSTGYDL